VSNTASLGTAALNPMEETTDASFGNDSGYPQPDPAAILGAACSLKRVWIDDVDLETRLQLAQRLPGVDSVMREILQIATRFEVWACRNVDFEEWDEVWPYFLEAEFGEACVKALDLERLPIFGDVECAAIAKVLRLPLRD
jgi:hypothetical protein